MPFAPVTRLRHRLQRAQPPREELVAKHVEGRSFLDVGCMWSVNGAIAFAAEDAGATKVTGVDIMPPTAEYEAEHARRNSSMRFVAADLHDEGLAAQVGHHDVVWCSGVLYHVPSPVDTIRALWRLAAGDGSLILATEVLPGRGTTCVFAPEPGTHPTHTEAFRPDGGYVNWWWGMSHGAVVAMVGAAGLRVVEEHRTVYHSTVVARAA